MQLITDLKDLPFQPCMRLFHSKPFNSELAADWLLGRVIRLDGWHRSDIPKPAICLVDRILSSSGTFFRWCLLWKYITYQADESGSICQRWDLYLSLFLTFLLEFVMLRALSLLWETFDSHLFIFFPMLFSFSLWLWTLIQMWKLWTGSCFTIHIQLLSTYFNQSLIFSSLPCSSSPSDVHFSRERKVDQDHLKMIWFFSIMRSTAVRTDREAQNT